METIVATFILFAIAFVGFGVGVLFFGKTAQRDACGRVPELDECPSQKAGICPIEDKTGSLKLQRYSKISYSKQA